MKATEYATLISGIVATSWLIVDLMIGLSNKMYGMILQVLF